jgi:PBSX family phage terminase large subunit
MAKFQLGELSQQQLDSWLESDCRLNIWEGAVRSGKTIVSILRWLEFVKSNKHSVGELLMVGKTERTLKRNILDVIEKIVGAKYYKLVQGAGEVYIYGRKVYICGANDERAQDKIRGMTLMGAYGDELTIWAESFFKMLLSRLSEEGAKFFGTTNPDSPYHWLRKEYLLNDELDLASWHFRLEDNPHLAAGYADNLKKEYTGLWYKRFIEGLWVMAEGAIYDMWDEAKHVRAAPLQILDRFIVGIDYGTSNPCTFGLYGWSSSAGFPVYLLSEYWWDSKKKGRQKSDSQYGDDFVRWLNGIYPEAIYCDPSAASFITELRGRGFIVNPANNDVLDGIRFVSNMLSDKQFYVSPDCTATTEEFSSYVWNGKSQEKGIDEPLKVNDHTMDRNRYALYTHFGQFQEWSDYSEDL